MQIEFVEIEKIIPNPKNPNIHSDEQIKRLVKIIKTNGFNHKEFYEWAREVKEPLFVSEYNINQDFLKLIWSNNVRSTLSATNNACKKVEKIYCNQIAWERLKRR